MQNLNQDGVKRNFTKMKREWPSLKNALTRDLGDWLRKPWDMHAYVDIFVEAGRAANYTLGHVHAVLYPLLAILVICGWAF